MINAITVFSIVGGIIFVGFLSNLLFKKTGLPSSLFLILIGIILGPVLNVFSPADVDPITPFLTTLTLMMILFEGGLNMDIYKVISQSFRAAILAILYITSAAAFVTLFAHFILGFQWLEALMLGPMTAGTSSVVIIPLVSKLDINKEVEVTLSLESTITDVLNIVLVLAILQTYLRGLVDIPQTVVTILGKFAIGAVLGAVVGIVWIRMLYHIRKEEYTYMFTLGVLIGCYATSEVLGGSGPLTALLFGLMLGNDREIFNTLKLKLDLAYLSEIKDFMKRTQGELAFLIRAFFFVFLGLIYNVGGGEGITIWIGILYAVIIVSVNLIFRHAAATIATWKSDMFRFRRFMTFMCGIGLANATLSILLFRELSPTVPYAYLYPAIITNIIIVTNIVTSIAPLLFKLRK
ncbi:MAG: cation:proton antiporter [Candidatus Bathyarchaeota archaeon]|nr:MAG: cation:proton antiporter [Candidatus Bathyarchaeota archaeon]